MNSLGFREAMAMFLLCMLLIPVNASSQWEQHSYQQLKAGNISKEIQMLSLQDQGITNVSSDDFLGLKRLYALNLGKNQITAFPNLSSIMGNLNNVSL